MSKIKSSGFTLVEIAIVLVIIGLLLGGVLNGQTLIKNAKYNAWVGEIDSYRSAFTTFVTTYRALPGDMNNASSRLEAPTGVAIRNGNGSGVIDGGGNSGLNVESGVALQHLILAGLIKGDPAPETGNVRKGTPVGGTYNSIATGNWANGKWGHKLLMFGVPGDLCQRLDEEFDDGDASTGVIARHEGNGEWDPATPNNIFIAL